MKRVLRIMQNHGLILERHTAHRPGRTHDGVVIALHSNIRWCSDHLELHARNREVVRILFVLDACDREIIAWSAVANAGISGEMVRDLMVAAVERRFATTTHAPHRMAVRAKFIPTQASLDIVSHGDVGEYSASLTRRGYDQICGDVHV